MMELSRLDGKAILVNPDHVRFVEKTPDTMLTFVDGTTLLVQQSADEVREKFIESKRAVSQGENKQLG